jgi:hypothetical protein
MLKNICGIFAFLWVAFFANACGDDSSGLTRCTGGGCPEGDCDNSGPTPCSFDWSEADPCATSSGEDDFCLVFDDEEYAVQCSASESDRVENCSATGTACMTGLRRGVWAAGCDSIPNSEGNGADEDNGDPNEDPVVPVVSECWGGCPASQECGGFRENACTFEWSEATACDSALVIDKAYCVTHDGKSYAVNCGDSVSVVDCSAQSEVCYADNIEGSGWYAMCFLSESSSSGWSNVMSCDGECAFEGQECGFGIDEQICTMSWSTDAPCEGDAVGASCVSTYTGTYAVNCDIENAYVQCETDEVCEIDGISSCVPAPL